MNTEPCPAFPDGTARQCGHCDSNLEIGAPAARNEFGTLVHPECVDKTFAEEPIPEWVPPPPPVCPDDIDPRAWAYAARELKHWQWETPENYERRLLMFASMCGDRFEGETR